MTRLILLVAPCLAGCADTKPGNKLKQLHRPARLPPMMMPAAIAAHPFHGLCLPLRLVAVAALIDA
jgi:hypothetical protein